MSATKLHASSRSHPKTTPQIAFSLPVVMLTGGLLLIGASFLPIGDWLARSQWTPEDAAAFGRISSEYKQAVLESPSRRGLSPAEWDAQRDEMKRRMLAWQAKLDRAKSQPSRWRRNLLGVGVLLTAAGFFTNSSRGS